MNQYRGNFSSQHQSTGASKGQLFYWIALIAEIQYFSDIMPRLNEAWPGNNRFCCSCCITGPAKDTPGLVFIYICQTAMIVSYSIIVLPSNWALTPVLPLLYLASSILLNLFIVLTACTDPGIIPRKPFLDRDPNKYYNFLARTDSQNTVFCQTCYIYRPARGSHCSRCQNCVELFDHHCGIVGNCIGKRNYRYFSMFIASLIVTITIFIVNIVVYLVTQSSSQVSKVVVIVVAAAIGGVIGLPIILFACFHMYLCLAGRTTREVMKDIRSKEDASIQWCEVDPSNLDFFEEVSQAEIDKIQQQVIKMRNNMTLQYTIELEAG